MSIGTMLGLLSKSACLFWCIGADSTTKSPSLIIAGSIQKIIGNIPYSSFQFVHSIDWEQVLCDSATLSATCACMVPHTEATLLYWNPVHKHWTNLCRDDFWSTSRWGSHKSWCNTQPGPLFLTFTRRTHSALPGVRLCLIYDPNYV